MSVETNHKRDDLLSARQLKDEHGWTDAMIRDLLGDPDDTRRNPYNSSSGKPMRLWLKERVEAIEATDGFRDRAELARSRSRLHKEITDAKAEELLRRAQEIEINVSTKPLEDITREAIRSYNQHSMHKALTQEGESDFEPASEDSDPAFLDRIRVNCIRHEHTSYETFMDAYAGQIGNEKARRCLRRRVMLAIAAAYPTLAAECERQINDRDERDMWVTQAMQAWG